MGMFYLQVEKVMFEAAQSREEYYKLLAQKIYLIRKELEDRKRNKSRGIIMWLLVAACTVRTCTSTVRAGYPLNVQLVQYMCVGVLLW